MILFLGAQDLSFFWLGLIEGLQFIRLEKYSVSPEGYLMQIDHFLLKQGQQSKDLEGICVVTGPGSFTASRISLTIANTLHFVHGTPLFVLENPDHLAPTELLSSQGLGSSVTSEQFAHVSYDRPPHITQPRGDKSLDSLVQKC